MWGFLKWIGLNRSPILASRCHNWGGAGPTGPCTMRSYVRGVGGSLCIRQTRLEILPSSNPATSLAGSNYTIQNEKWPLYVRILPAPPQVQFQYKTQVVKCHSKEVVTDAPFAHDTSVACTVFLRQGDVYKIILRWKLMSKTICKTRMHSSRMRTVRSSDRISGGGCLLRGVSAPGWVVCGIPACTEADTPPPPPWTDRRL